jgi:hypothetical protein
MREPAERPNARMTERKNVMSGRRIVRSVTRARHHRQCARLIAGLWPLERPAFAESLDGNGH